MTLLCTNRDKTETLFLTLGVIDDAAITVFTKGQCASLAVALHDLAGWDIYGVLNGPDGGIGHVVVADMEAAKPWWGDVNGQHGLAGPNQGDINGQHDIAGPNQCRADPITRDQALSIPGYAPQQVHLAVPFAETLIEQWATSGAVK